VSHVKGDYKCFATSLTGGMMWNIRDPAASWQASWNTDSEASQPPWRKYDHPETTIPHENGVTGRVLGG